MRGQFWETAEGTYVPDDHTRVQRHSEMVDYFSGKWAGVEKPYNKWCTSYQPTRGVCHARY